MAGTLADVFVSVRGKTDKLGTDVEKGAKTAGEKAGKSFSGSFSSVLGGVSKLFAGIAVAGFLKDTIAEARESVRVGKITAAVIKSTGGAARITAANVGNLATAISNVTGTDDELIQSGENMLLTFTKIRNEAGKGNDIFDKATVATTNLAAAMNNGAVTGDGLKTASIQIGKALNDPLKGMTALQKVGVSFSKTQKDQIADFIKSGNIMGAQKVILAELNKEFGGVAAAAADPAQKAQVAWKNFEESIGLKLLPILGRLIPIFESMLPKIENIASAFIDWSTRSKFLRATVQSAEDLVGWMSKWPTWVKEAVAGLTAGMVALDVAMDANPVGIVIVALAALAVGITWVATKTHFFQVAWADTWGFLKAVGAWFAGPFANFFVQAGRIIAGVAVAIAQPFIWLWHNVFYPVFTGIRTIVQVALDLIMLGFHGFMALLNISLIPAIKFLAVVFKVTFDGVAKVFTGFYNLSIKPIVDFLVKLFKVTFPLAVKTGVDQFKSSWALLKALAVDPIKFVVNVIINKGLIDTFNTVLGWFTGKKGTVGHIVLPFAEGGAVPMVNGAERGKDSVLAMLTPGEGVLTTGEMAALGGASGFNALRSHLKGYADGGIVDLFSNPLNYFRGKVAAAGDVISKWGDTPFTEMAKAAPARIVNEVADWAQKEIGKLFGAVGAAGSWLKNFLLLGGGPPSANVIKAMSFLQAQNGKPYIWASAGPSGYDCSGIVSAVWNVLHGSSPYNHTFSTGNEGPYFPISGVGGVLTAGWANPGERGASKSVGHTAGMLAGFPFESTGSRGVHMGSGSTPVTDFAHVGHFVHGGVVSYDRGGYLPTGLSLAYNGTGKPEQVGGGINFSPTYHVAGDLDEQRLAKATVQRLLFSLATGAT